METQPVEDMPDGVLLDAILSHERIMRRHAERLGILNHEWTARHVNDRCGVDCREPRAPLSKVPR